MFEEERGAWFSTKRKFLCGVAIKQKVIVRELCNDLVLEFTMCSGPTFKKGFFSSCIL